MLPPAKCPELNPVENLVQFMRDSRLSSRVVTSCQNLLGCCCHAQSIEHEQWAEPGAVRATGKFNSIHVAANSW